MANITWNKGTVVRLVGLLVLLAGAVFAFAWSPEQPVPEPVTVVRPAKTLVVSSAGRDAGRVYSGVVQASEQVDLSFRVSGPLIELPVAAGQEVAAGDLLAQIDPRDYRSQLARVTGKLEEARARLRAMKAGEREEVIRMRETELAAAEAEAENARIELERLRTLAEQGVVSQSEFDQAQLRSDTANQLRESAEQALRQAREGARPEDIEAQEAVVRGLEAQETDARNALSDTTLRAPFDGVVARRYVENFQDVRATQRIVSLQDVSVVDIVADVPESVVVMARREMVERVTVTFDSLPDRSFDVTYKEMETEADSRTQTYAVTVEMPAPEDVNILPGMAASLNVRLKPEFMEMARGVPVPVSAVFTDPEGRPHVWKLAPDTMTVSLAPVAVDAPSGDQILVTSGLVDDEEIVTAGVHFLSEGMKVRRLENGR
jgi:RND family efflux transporter MFP subunit